ncbi:MAG TPA: hypothetical protein VKB51_00320 [bacterium]|nr:hypothetical protein [bacterium]
MNRFALLILLCSLAVASTSSCSLGFGARDALAPQLDAKSKPDGAFVFGYIDMKAAKTGLDWAYLKQTEPKVFDPDHTSRAFQNVFYLENLPDGVFRLDGFGGNTWSFFHKGQYFFATYPVDYNLQLASKVQVRVDRPGVYFMGAYRYVHHDSGFLGDDTFSLEPISEPTERQVLERILPEAKGGPWEPLLRKHLAQLP